MIIKQIQLHKFPHFSQGRKTNSSKKLTQPQCNWTIFDDICYIKVFNCVASDIWPIFDRNSGHSWSCRVCSEEAHFSNLRPNNKNFLTFACEDFLKKGHLPFFKISFTIQIYTAKQILRIPLGLAPVVYLSLRITSIVSLKHRIPNHDVISYNPMIMTMTKRWL